MRTIPGFMVYSFVEPKDDVGLDPDSVTWRAVASPSDAIGGAPPL